MSGVKFIILGVAAVAGVGAVALVQSELDRARQSAGDVVPVVEEVERTRVLVAARSLRRGENLRDGALEWRDWPADLVSESFITEDNRPEALVEFEAALAKGALSEGEPVKTEKLIMLDHPGVLSAMLRPGMRAFAISIAQETGAGGFVLPSDYVDVILTREIEMYVCDPEGEFQSRSYLKAETLLTTVRVLAVDSEFDTGEEANTAMERTTTLEVTPDQSVLLSLAERAGRLTLALRGIGDLVDDNGAPRPELFPETAADLDLAQELLAAVAATRVGAEGEAAGEGAPTVPVFDPRGSTVESAEDVQLVTHSCSAAGADEGPTVQVLRGNRLSDMSVQ